MVTVLPCVRFLVVHVLRSRCHPQVRRGFRQPDLTKLDEFWWFIFKTYGLYVYKGAYDFSASSNVVRWLDSYCGIYIYICVSVCMSDFWLC